MYGMSRDVVGPKGETLQQLRHAGLPVPDARFLGVTAYREHAARAGVDEMLDRGATAADLRAAIVSAEVDERLAATIAGWHDELGPALAVRSSGTAEDLADASFAGQHGTYFVGTAEDAVRAVRDCWASLFSERAWAYRASRGIAHGGAAMAVIVQRLVPAVCAGVAFTRDPVTRDERIVIEACRGLGESLVSGRVTPDRFVLSADGARLLEERLGDMRVRLAVTESATVSQMDVAPEERAGSLDAATAREVAALAIAVEAEMGVPVDIEWAHDGVRTWLLQARPITGGAVAAPSQAPGPAAPSPLRSAPTIWSNVNTGEILPDVATPMTWSLIHGHADDIFTGMMGAFGVTLDAQELIGLVGGRIYFNLTLLRETFSTMPGIDSDVALGGLHEYWELPPLEQVRGRPPWPALARAAVAMPLYIARHTPKRAVRFAAEMRRTTEASERDIAAVTDRHEAYRLFRSLDRDFMRFNEALAYMAVAMFGFGLLGGLTKRWLGDETGALANRLVAGSGQVESADAGLAMWRLGAMVRGSAPVRNAVLVGAGWADVRERLEASASAGVTQAQEFLAAWDGFMAEHGHHRRGELEFSNPTWAETPDYVLGIVRSYLTEDRASDPLAAYAARSAEADRAAREALRRLPGPKRLVFSRALAWGRASARTRENVKSEAVRWLVAIRHALLALGGLLAADGVLERADDVFFAQAGELDRLVAEGGDTWRGLVASRRAEHARLERLSPPPVVVGDWDERAWVPAAGARVLTGISVSAGVARGPARVFLTADTDEPVLPGEILVAPFTDPGWTPYFVPAAGIVMDMGGLLSHGSIIAREYGIPAVVNVGPATKLIETGDLVEVDGDAGVVRILG